ncbi:hypothetical protein TNCV_681481 [Trichonephila clavipes]|nr:hypothetical protein TNCV_681481 [Trichonephila clavipes]
MISILRDSMGLGIETSKTPHFHGIVSRVDDIFRDGTGIDSENVCTNDTLIRLFTWFSARYIEYYHAPMSCSHS